MPIRKRARNLLKNALVFLNKPMNKCRIKLKLARPQSHNPPEPARFRGIFFARETLPIHL